jgi:hypothetical protein
VINGCLASSKGGNKYSKGTSISTGDEPSLNNPKAKL